MQQFTEALELALSNKNWYAALAIALTLPDICGWLKNPNENVGQRYSNWYDKHFLNTYIEKLPNDIREGLINKGAFFLSGKDCYRLRCAYLHSGVDDITNHSPKNTQSKEQQIGLASNFILNKFIFCKPTNNGLIHYNRIGGKDGFVALQLDVNEFCKDMCHSVKKWQIEVANKDTTILERMKQFLIIRDYPTEL